MRLRLDREDVALAIVVVLAWLAHKGLIYVTGWPPLVCGALGLALFMAFIVLDRDSAR